MKLSDIPPAYTGSRLDEAVEGAEHQREVIAEGLIYEKTNLMIASDPGLGKSTISTQVAVELASGLPIFGHFYVPRPFKVFYIQAERHIMETFERIRQIKLAGRPINSTNLVVTDKFQVLNLLKYDHAVFMIESIERDCGTPDIIFIDPIYSMVSGGLKDDKPASAFTKVMSVLQSKFGCALWLNHHTTKQQYSSSGDKMGSDDRFYGSQWLKASVTGSYQMEKQDKGVVLKCKKDNYGLLLSQINLEYDAATELCHVTKLSQLPAEDRVKNYLQTMRDRQEWFSYYDIMESCQVSKRLLTSLILHTRVKDKLETQKSLKGKKLFRIKRDEML